MKKYEELSLMTEESDAKFEEKLGLGFKIDMTNLVNFDASSGKSENLHFDVLLLSVAYIFSYTFSYTFSEKSSKELSVITLRCDSNFGEKLTFCLKNDRNFMNFNSSSGKPENFYLDGIFCQKYEMFELK